MATEELEVLREKERYRLTGLSRVQWWRLERAGRVPRRVQLGDNSVGWLKGEIQAWIGQRAALRGSTSERTPRGRAL
jgi:prophage regulatory protein